MSNVPTERSKQVARQLARIFGGRAQVHLFGDDNEESSVFVLTCHDAPQKGISTYATVSLVDTELSHDGKKISLRGEIIAACRSDAKQIDNAVATAAFYVLNSGYELYPGSIFPEVLKVVGASKKLKHFLFTAPFLWPNLEFIEVDHVRVGPLLAVPITDDEMGFAVEKGPAELERLFEKEQIDIFDINRPSIIRNSRK